MKFNKIRTIMLLFFVLLLPVSGLANGTSDYLITEDIGSYKRITKGGPSGNILAGAGHFGLDHRDKSYGIAYVNDQTQMWIEVQVTQHAGSDSDKWLLHEVERGFRDSSTLSAGMAESARLREINDNKIFFYGGGIVAYSWLSNNIVINIQYTNLSGPKPEPLEVVQAYLAKYPSTIPAMTIDQAHNEKWLKDEMDRRLWLGGKWMGQIKTAGDLDKLSDVVKNLNVFLDYREKYYGIEARTEKGALFTAQQNKDKAAIEAKLNEYYKWWNENKGKAINL